MFIICLALNRKTAKIESTNNKRANNKKVYQRSKNGDKYI